MRWPWQEAAAHTPHWALLQAPAAAVTTHSPTATMSQLWQLSSHQMWPQHAPPWQEELSPKQTFQAEEPAASTAACDLES